MAEFFGTLERIAADLYPWRWPILAAVLVLGAAATYYAYRREIHLALWRRRRLTAIIATPFLIVFGFLAWGLGSPLFIDETVEEEFPFAYTAVVPEGMEMEDIEMTMAVVAAMDDEPMMEAMPEMMMEEEERPKGRQAEGRATSGTPTASTEAAARPSSTGARTGLTCSGSKTLT